MLTPTLPAGAFLAVWGFLALNVMSPGPNVLNTISLAMGSGRRAGIGAALGAGLGFGLWCAGMLTGAAALLARLPALRLALTALAAGLLVWFAWRYLRASREGFALRRRSGPPAPMGRAGVVLAEGFWRSLGVIATNPKALTTWLAVLGIFPLAQAGAGDLVVLWAGTMMLSAAIHGTYALVFSTAPAARAWARAAPVLNLCVAVIFLGFAAALARGLAAGLS